MTATVGVDLAGVGAALGRRARDIAAAVARLDSFGPAPADNQPAGPLLTTAAARALLVRAVHVATAPAADALLRRLSDRPATGRELASVVGQPRVVLWEMVSDLVQVGLAERDLEHDRVRLTAAGRGIVELLDHLAASGTALGEQDTS